MNAKPQQIMIENILKPYLSGFVRITPKFFSSKDDDTTKIARKITESQGFDFIPLDATTITIEKLRSICQNNIKSLLFLNNYENMDSQISTWLDRYIAHQVPTELTRFAFCSTRDDTWKDLTCICNIRDLCNRGCNCGFLDQDRSS